MIVFAFPPLAGAETAPYLLRGTQYEEKTPAGDLIVVPKGAAAPPNAAAPVFCMDGAAPVGAIVSEALAQERGDLPVWISSRLSGGTLKARLQAALARYGARLYLRIEPLCTLFPMPCPTGQGQDISQEECAAMQEGHPAFFSFDLCCNYCVISNGQNASMLLFDTPDTIAKKLHLASRLGVPYAFGEIPLSAL